MAAMKKIILRELRVPVADLEPLLDRHDASLRVATVEGVLGSISEDERFRLRNEATIHDGASGNEIRWIFLFLCAAATVRPGSGPIDIARDIQLARTATGILLD